MKSYSNISIVYAILAMIGGVFYREFTKFQNFTEQTTLSVLHTHYFVLGMLFFLVLLLLEKNFAFTNKKTKLFCTLYHIGLNLTTVMLTVRGVTQVLQMQISNALDASISGMSGIGHILLGVSMIVLLLQVKRSVQ